MDNIFHKNLFTLQNVPSDGNCLFNSIMVSSNTIYGSGLTSEQLRSSCGDFFIKRPNFKLENFTVNELLIHSGYPPNPYFYRNLILRNSNWGSDLENILLSHVYHFNIHVYIPYKDDSNYYQLINSHGNYEDGQNIHLLLNNKHYQALIPNIGKNIGPKTINEIIRKRDEKPVEPVVVKPDYKDVYNEINKLVDSGLNDIITIIRNDPYNNNVGSYFMVNELLNKLRRRCIDELNIIYNKPCIHIINRINNLLQNLYHNILKIQNEFYNKY